MKYLQVWDTAFSARFGLTPDHANWPLAARLAHLGDGGLVFTALGVAYLIGWVFDWPALQANMRLLLITLLVTAAVVFIIKYTLRRERPRDPSGFVTIRYDKYSFPSGHSARMSCLAVTVLYFSLPVGLLLLLLALLVAAARVLVTVHYLSDVIAGLVIGAVVAVAVAVAV